MSELIVRATPLIDLEVKKDGRTVVAYAATFGDSYEVRDAHGHYLERNSAQAFNKVILERGTRFGVFYNHGMSIHGTPLTDLGSVPLGTPKIVRAEKRGLLTETYYGENPFADAVLQAIRDGSIEAYSHTSGAVKSSPERVPRVSRGGALPTVTRLELSLREYGPTPLPVNGDAGVLAVRSAAMLAPGARLTDDQRATLLYQLLTPTTAADVGVGQPEAYFDPTGAGDRGAGDTADAGVHHSARDRQRAITRAATILGDLNREHQAVGEVRR